MSVLTCIVADDEPIARQIIENYIDAIPNLELVASCKNAFEVLEIIQESTVDLIFLDINMPKLSGLSLLKVMQHKPAIIITTAYPEYAVEGFELAVTDYLLKPFSFERFLQAVNKVQRKKHVTKEVSITSKKEIQDFIFVKSDKKMIKLSFENINHVEAYGNYIKIFADTMILSPQTLTDFLNKLPDSFVRIHKSFLVNFNKLKLIDGNQIILDNSTKLTIGKSYRKDVLERI